MLSFSRFILRESRYDARSYPWIVPHKGWWNPQLKKGMTFVFRYASIGGNYHITQVFKDPAFFGISRESLISIILKAHPEKCQYGAPRMYEKFADGLIDTDYVIERMIMDRGWVKVTRELNNPQTLLQGKKKYLRETVGSISLAMKQDQEFSIYCFDEDSQRGVTVQDHDGAEAYYKGRIG